MTARRATDQRRQGQDRQPHAGGPSPRDAALAAILGLPAGADAATLLGVDPARTDEAEVVQALHERLALVNAHRLGATPLGDEARLALHGAAAELLGSLGTPRATAHAGPAPSAARSLPEPNLALEHDAILALGAHGGWNARTMHHLTMLAHARGLTADDLAVALARLARGGPAQGAPSGLRPPAPPPGSGAFMPAGPVAPDHDDELAGTRPRGSDLALLGAMALAVLLTLLAAGAVLIAIPAMRTGSLRLAGPPQATQQAAQADPNAPAPPDRTPADGLRVPSAETPAQAAPAQAADHAERGGQNAEADQALGTLLGDLRQANALLRQGQPGASARFRQAVQTLAAGWPALPADERQAALGLVIDHLYLARQDTRALAQALAVLTEPMVPFDPAEPADADRPTLGSAQLAAWCWQVGAAVRLSREANLPPRAVEAFRGYLMGTAPVEARAADRFEAGVAAALRARLRVLADPQAFVADPADWDHWLAAVQGLARSDPALAHRLTLAGLESMLLAGPEPTDERAFGIVRRLTLALPWDDDQAGREARQRLLAWMEDPGVSAADVHAVTATLATALPAAGLDATMVLPALADPTQRASLRDAVAQRWGLATTVAQGKVVRRWLDRARAHLDQPLPGDWVGQALDAAVSARLVAAARWLQMGQGQPASDRLDRLLDGLGRTAATPPPQTRSIYLASHGDPTDWARQYLAQKRPELQADLLETLLQGGPSHAVEAELVALAYLRGSTHEVRHKAGQILMTYAGQPVVVSAVLEALPLPGSAQRRRQMVELVTAVRLPDSDDWELLARRTLVERLLELLAGQGELATIDRAAQAIARAYLDAQAGAVSFSQGDQGPSQQGAQDALADAPPELAAQMLLAGALQRAQRVVPPPVWPWTLEQVQGHLAGRRRLARGRVQAFAAEQSALAEVELYLAAAEHPGLAVRLGDELSAMQQARRRAVGVLEQVALVERARVRACLLTLTHAAGGTP
ncbi:MAG: hypothetical protein KatS3mg103_0765 [Phycisphaerales bacterium]|nr:MAG: hypothetical protein KatS3mg103_0765 [Phycisphaerales bacterium]